MLSKRVYRPHLFKPSLFFSSSNFNMSGTAGRHVRQGTLGGFVDHPINPLEPGGPVIGHDGGGNIAGRVSQVPRAQSALDNAFAAGRRTVQGSGAGNIQSRVDAAQLMPAADPNRHAAVPIVSLKGLVHNLRNSHSASLQIKYARRAIVAARLSAEDALIAPLLGKLLGYIYTVWTKQPAGLYAAIGTNKILTYFEKYVTESGIKIAQAQYHSAADSEKAQSKAESIATRVAFRVLFANANEASNPQAQVALANRLLRLTTTRNNFNEDYEIPLELANWLIVLTESAGSDLKTAMNLIKVVMPLVMKRSTVGPAPTYMRILDDAYTRTKVAFDALGIDTDAALGNSTFLVPRGFVTSKERETSERYAFAPDAKVGDPQAPGVPGAAGVPGGVAGGFYSKHPILQPSASQPWAQGGGGGGVGGAPKPPKPPGDKGPPGDPMDESDAAWRDAFFQSLASSGENITEDETMEVIVDKIGDLGYSKLARERFSITHIPDVAHASLKNLRDLTTRDTEALRREAMMDTELAYKEVGLRMEVDKAIGQLVGSMRQRRCKEFRPAVEAFALSSQTPQHFPMQVQWPPLDARLSRGLKGASEVSDAFFQTT